VLSPNLRLYAERIASTREVLSIEDRVVIESLQQVNGASPGARSAALDSLRQAVDAMRGQPLRVVRHG
jgi:hypothetical protein